MSLIDVLIIGGGPAGLSAALTLVRQKHSVIVFDTGKSRALASPLLHGVLGSDAEAPEHALKRARTELEVYKDYKAIFTEIIEVQKVDVGFQARDKAGVKYHGTRLVLANGVNDRMLDIEGYAEAWGKRM